MTRRAAILLAVGLLMIARPASPQDWKENLATKFGEVITITKTTMDRLRITEPGTLVIIKADGIAGDLARDATYLINKYEDGAVKQAGGVAAFLANKKTSRQFRPGERAYVTKIEVRDDAVRFFLVSAETHEATVSGSTQQTRYKTALDVVLPKGSLAAMEFPQVKEAVEAVIAIDAPGTAAGAKTVQLGMTREEVEKVFGKPDKVIDLGAKVLYVYKDLKVTFTDGKVSDVS